jgi:hypothetical protein
VDGPDPSPSLLMRAYDAAESALMMSDGRGNRAEAREDAATLAAVAQAEALTKIANSLEELVRLAHRLAK